MLNVKSKKIADVKTPHYVHKGDSGVDLYSAEDYVLKPMERRLISTGIKIEIPHGYEAQVRPKSGLAIEHGISHANSIVPTEFAWLIRGPGKAKKRPGD